MTDGKSAKDRVEKDAAGQYGASQADRKNNGVDSAKPRVITGSDDATANTVPPGQADENRELTRKGRATDK